MQFPMLSLYGIAYTVYSVDYTVLLKGYRQCFTKNKKKILIKVSSSKPLYSLYTSAV